MLTAVALPLFSANPWMNVHSVPSLYALKSTAWTRVASTGVGVEADWIGIAGTHVTVGRGAPTPPAGARAARRAVGVGSGVEKAALAVAPTAARSVPSTQGVGRTSEPDVTVMSNARVSQPTPRQTTTETIAVAQRRRDIEVADQGLPNQFFTADTILVVVQ